MIYSHLFVEIRAEQQKTCGYIWFKEEPDNRRESRNIHGRTCEEGSISPETAETTWDARELYV